MHLTDLGSYKAANDAANETGKSKKGGKPAYLQSLNESEK